MVRLLCCFPLVAVACISLAAARAQETSAEFSDDVKALPFPPDAQLIEFDTSFKDIEFVSRSPLSALAEFYRREMAARGWQEDSDAASIEEDEIELEFEHGSATVTVELDRDSDGNVDVTLDCEGLAWDGANDPALLAKAGVPQPRSHLFLNGEFPRPEDSSEVKYADNACKFKCSLDFELAARHFQKALTKLGWRQDADKPFLGKYIHRYAYRRGPVTLTVSANKNHLGPGSWITVEYASTEKEPAPASLPPVGQVAGRTPEPAPPPDTQPVNVAANKGSATVTLGPQKFKLNHVVAYVSKSYGEDRTIVVFCEKAIPYAKMQQLLAREDDFSFGDLYKSGWPSFLTVHITDDDIHFAFSGPGMGFNGEAEGVDRDVKQVDGRVQGTIKMTQPFDFFDKPFRFQATLDAAIMRHDTRLADGAGATVPGSSADSALNDSHGLPVPNDASEVASTKTRYRKQVDAKVDLPLAEVVAIYRRELPARQWIEDASAAKVSAESATLTFKTATGPLTIALTAAGDATAVHLVTRDVAAARRDGVLPEAGKVRLVLGNAHSREIVISIGTADYRLAPGRGAKDPKTALKYSVSPGKYRFTVKIPGEAPQTETLEAPPDTTWGILGLPTGGYIAEQMY